MQNPQDKPHKMNLFDRGNYRDFFGATTYTVKFVEGLKGLGTVFVGGTLCET